MQINIATINVCLLAIAALMIGCKAEQVNPGSQTLESITSSDPAYKAALQAQSEGELVAARSLMQNACEVSFDVPPCADYIDMLLNGAGGPVDLKTARRIADATCLGNRACGRLTDFDKVEANKRSEVEDQCYTGNPRACLTAGGMYWDGYGGESDPEKTETLYAKACDSDVSEACQQLATVLSFKDDSTRDIKRERELTKKSCDLQNALGCIKYSVSMMSGPENSRDYAESRRGFNLACDLGDMIGCHQYGLLQQEGLGGAKNASKARLLFTLGCSDNHAPSCDSLTKMDE